MKKPTSALIATGILLVAAAVAQPALAQGSCASITFDQSILSQFPNANASCLGVVTREGKQYAHFQAEIVGTSGDTVRARFRRPNGEYSPTYSIAMSPDARVQIAGRSYRYRDLSRGQELDVYVPPNLWQVVIPDDTSDFATAENVDVATPTLAQADTGGGELPQTASPIPLFGIIGGVLSVLGLALIAITWRQRSLR